jgi:hypothetical protein
MLDHPAVKRFIRLVESWNATIWGELLLWETLEGIRPKPFLFLPELEPADMHMLRFLRDELKMWPTHVPGEWDLIPIKAWRLYAQQHPADSVRDRFNEAG